MDDLLPIGRFAQLTRLTPKALRLYDTMGLLRPAAVDFATGYRSYHLGQIAIAERIRFLRAVEMPLTEIQALLAEEDPEAVHAHLTAHRRRIIERIDGYRQALRLLDTLEAPDARKEGNMTAPPLPNVIHCSFCGKGSKEVRRMIAGPNGVFICDECVGLCNGIIAKHEAETGAERLREPHA